MNFQMFGSMIGKVTRGDPMIKRKQPSNQLLVKDSRKTQILILICQKQINVVKSGLRRRYGTKKSKFGMCRMWQS